MDGEQMSPVALPPPETAAPADRVGDYVGQTLDRSSVAAFWAAAGDDDGASSEDSLGDDDESENVVEEESRGAPSRLSVGRRVEI